jgi:hypothetical protein
LIKGDVELQRFSIWVCPTSQQRYVPVPVRMSKVDFPVT